MAPAIGVIGLSWNYLGAAVRGQYLGAKRRRGVRGKCAVCHFKPPVAALIWRQGAGIGLVLVATHAMGVAVGQFFFSGWAHFFYL